MITTYCNLSGMPIAIAPMFSDFLRAKLSYHPIFSLDSAKLLDMAGAQKISRLSYDECYLLGLALLKTTDLIKFREALIPVASPSELQIRLMARFVAVARDTAIGVAELRRFPKQVAALYKDLPMFHATRESSTSELLNWAKMVLSKARLYVDTGKARRRADEHYAVALYMVNDESNPIKAKAINREYELPQLFDSDIGLWAYDKFTDEYSEEAQTLHEQKFKQVYNMLVLGKTTALKGESLRNLSRVLDEVLPLDTPYNQRCKQLTLAYLDKARSAELQLIAGTLGEQLTTATRTVGDASWSYVVLDTSSVSSSAGSDAGGASIAASGATSVKGGGSATSPKGRPLHTSSHAANVPPAAPATAPRITANPAQLAKLRARLQRG